MVARRHIAPPSHARHRPFLGAQAALAGILTSVFSTGARRAQACGTGTCTSFGSRRRTVTAPDGLDADIVMLYRAEDIRAVRR